MEQVVVLELKSASAERKRNMKLARCWTGVNTTKRDWKKVKQVIDDHDRFLVITHHYPDGDGLGSSLGLSQYLKHLGKESLFVSEHAVPKALQFVDPECSSVIYDRDNFDWSWPEVVFILDTCERNRLGAPGEDLPWDSIKTVCIDHHRITGTLPAGVNVIDPNASSVGELIVDLIANTTGTVATNVAAPLYVAMLMDTGGFRFANTTGAALRAAATLADAGADPEALYEHAYETNTWTRLKLFGEMLRKASLIADDRIAYCALSKEDFEETGSDPEEIEGFVEYLRTVDTVMMSLLFREVDGKVKVSLRSRDKVNVAKFASGFGGGGHMNASGFVSTKGLEETVAETLEVAQRFIDEQPNDIAS